MTVNLEAERLHALFKHVRGRLTRILRQRDRADIETKAAENVDEPRHVGIVGDAQIAAALVLFDVARVDGDDDFRLIAQASSILILLSGAKPGSTRDAVVIVKELAAKFQIELAAKLVDPLTNMFGLQPDILFAVKTDLIHLSLSIPSGCACLPQILIQKPLRLFSISNSLAAFKLKCKKVFDKKRAEPACTSAKGFKIPKVCTHVQSLRSFLRITTRRPVKSKAARY